jgi:hypothetical protein
MDKFRVQGYVDFLTNTKTSAMLIKDVLEERNITLVHANSGTSKTSAWGYDLAAAMLAQQSWLGHFDILAQNVYVFFVSQDAPAHDVVRHSQKVFRRYFDLKDRKVRAELNRRFNILDYEGIKFGKDSVDAEKLVESIRARLHDVVGQEQPEIPGFRDVSADESVRAAAALKRIGTDDDLPSVQPDEEPIAEPKVLILWDSLRKLHDGKESASDELKPVIDGLRHVNKELDATSILFHHNNRSGSIRGDASIEDAVDQSYAIKRVPGHKATDAIQLFDLNVEKPRGVALQPFRYRMTREEAHSEDELIRFEYVRELSEADLEERATSGAKKATAPSPGGVVEVDPVMAAARKHWKPSMSVRALHAHLTDKLKLQVGRARVSKMIETIRAERQVGAA